MEIKDVENLSELAKLDLTPEEKNNLLHDMEGILRYVQQIQDIDVDEMDVTYEQKNIWREDVPRGEINFSREIIVEQFPDSQDGYVKVKKIL